jgi:hypothetical protein
MLEKTKPKRKHPWGRPEVITQEKFSKLLRALEDWQTEEEACYYAWISVPTLRRKKQKDEKIWKEIEKAKNYMQNCALKTVKACLQQWDEKVAMWYLEKKHKDFKKEPTTIKTTSEETSDWDKSLTIEIVWIE